MRMDRLRFRTEALLSVCVGVIALILYLSCIPDSVVSGDSAELTYVIQTFQTPHPPGYPLYIVVSRFILFLCGEFSVWMVNATSAVYTALSMSILYLFMRDRGINLIAALTSITCLASSYPIWLISVKTEVYSFLILLFVLMLLLWSQTLTNDSYLGLLWFVAGLSLTHHPLNVFGVILAIHATVKVQREFSSYHVSLFVVPLSVYLVLLVPGSGEPFNWPHIGTLAALTDHVLGGSFYRFFLVGGVWGVIKQIQSIALSHLLAFPVLLFPAMLAGYLFRKSNDGILILIQFLIILILMLYGVPDVQDFLVPSYVVGTYFLSLFLNKIASSNRTATIGIGCLLLISVWAGSWFVSLRYDWSGYDFPRKYVQVTENTINEPSLILSDWSHYTLLRYYQARHDRLENLQLLTPTHHFSDWPKLIRQFLSKNLVVHTTVRDWKIPDDLTLTSVGYLYRVKSVSE